jgi:FixJ family two-component response regulator
LLDLQREGGELDDAGLAGALAPSAGDKAAEAVGSYGFRVASAVRRHLSSAAFKLFPTLAILNQMATIKWTVKGMGDKVFYVDDESSNLMALKRLFRDEAFEFITFDSPLEALKQMVTLRPAVVISDQCMPKMRGTEFLERVKDLHSDCVRIILTGYADLEAAMAAINKGDVFRFIQKPWDNEDLKNQVRAALAHQESINCLRTMVDALLDEVMDNEKAMKSIRKLAATVYNELDQPLMILGGYAQILKGYFKKEEIPVSYLDSMQVQMERLGRLSKKMGAISQKAHR